MTEAPLLTEQNTPTLWDLIGQSVAILWKDWPKDMKVTVLSAKERQFSLSGECPHCHYYATFSMVGMPDYGWANYERTLVVSIMKCPSCRRWILAIVKCYQTQADTFEYVIHYPLGAPNEKLDGSIPQDVAEDFREAIRCEHVKAYRACVVMCRRALETSIIGFKAKGSTLVHKIDDLASSGIITASLKGFAHEVRLTGNVGAHSDGLENIGESDAEDIMAFTRQYLEHVYILPAKLDARRSAKQQENKTP